MKKSKKGLNTCIALLQISLLFIANCGEERAIEQTPRQSERQPVAVSEQDTLTICEAVFEGGFNKNEIKERLDMALTLYDTPVTEENYSRAASVLVTFRKEHAIREMDILDYMIRSHVPGVKLTFPHAAALATVMLKSGDK